jgi:hypothetical protein
MDSPESFMNFFYIYKVYNIVGKQILHLLWVSLGKGTGKFRSLFL